MKKNVLLLTKEFIKVVIIVAVAVPMVSLFAAWTEPTMSPPDGNVPAPVNVGNIFQKKAGDFAVGGGFGVDGGAAFNLQYLNSDALKTILIDSSTGNMGLGTLNPQAKLDVVGNVKIADGTEGDGKVLTSDVSGLASWRTPTSGSGGGNTCGVAQLEKSVSSDYDAGKNSLFLRTCNDCGCGKWLFIGLFPPQTVHH